VTLAAACPAPPAHLRRWLSGGLWANRDFARLWWAQTVSQFGSQVSVVAFPLIAIQTLHAGPTDMGVLGALGRLPFVLYLAVGVWVDRTRRRPVLSSTDLARAALLLVVVVCGLAGALSPWLLGAVLFCSMLLGVWFDIAYMSFLPTLVDRRELMAGNVRLETSRAGAQAAGPRRHPRRVPARGCAESSASSSGGCGSSAGTGCCGRWPSPSG
jgi:MFS family permease